MRNSRTRKRPVTHVVHTHMRNRKRVKSYLRGNGIPESKFEAKIIRELPKPEPTPALREVKFRGSNYETWKHKPIKLVAKAVKAELKEAYPNIDVGVSTKVFSGGREINVKIKSYPYGGFLEKEVIYSEMKNYPPDKIPSYAYTWKYTKQAKEIVDNMKHILQSYNYDNSDMQTDYSETSFYGDVDFDWELMKVEEERIGLR